MMIMSSSSIAFLCYGLLAFVFVASVNGSTLDDRRAPLMCPICRSNDRPMLNPSHQFTMVNGITWTCKYLQETVQDVDMNGWESEKLMCRHAQLQAEDHGCLCGGASLPPLATQYSDIHPSCDMCATVSSSPIVPMSNWDKLVATGIIGTHNCKGLFEAMADGIIGSSLCPTVQQVAGPACCLESRSSSYNSGTSSNTNSQYMANNDYVISYNSGGSSNSNPSPTRAPAPPPSRAPVPASTPSCGSSFEWCAPENRCVRTARGDCGFSGRSINSRKRGRIANINGNIAAAAAF